MGTRADFYVGRGETAEWVGSIAWDGYPEGIMPHAAEKKRAWVDGPLMPAAAKWPVGAHLFDATTEQEFRERVARFFEYREDVTLPENGWPWPWENSQTTDYAYAFDGGKVYASCFGHQMNTLLILQALWSFHCTALVCQFDGTASTGTVRSWTWQFGDSTPTSSGKIVGHTFTKAGTYKVLLKVYDGAKYSQLTKTIATRTSAT
jgi:hypothetical protein